MPKIDILNKYYSKNDQNEKINICSLKEERDSSRYNLNKHDLYCMVKELATFCHPENLLDNYLKEKRQKFSDRRSN